jgi:HlyD family secretion protein/macrolide-specific efflux system membrane fusion protein
VLFRSFVVDAGQPGGVRRVEPKLGLPGLEKSEVLEGLAEGELVATQIVLAGQEKPAEARTGGDKPALKPAATGKKAP